MVYDVMSSPVGELLLTADAPPGEPAGLTGVHFDGHAPDATARAGWRRDPTHLVLRAARAQLEAYFAGALTRFDLPLAPRGTPFQERVWAVLGHVPFGETISYGDLARRVGTPAGSRAVGAANGRNPIPIIIPCHRVIGADGSLTGFGGGIERKRWLLAHEQGGTLL